ncbi:MAG: cytochrome c oxidase subunit II [Gaiellaceae bacterium]
MRRKVLALTCVVLVGLVVAGAALGGNGGTGPPTPESPNAQGISSTYWLILGITGGIFLLVESMLLLFVVRFRARGRPREADGPQIHGATRLELIWTVIPVLILAAIASFVLYKLPGIKNVPSAKAQGGRLEIRVEGHQFYWQFRYPNGVVAINRMRVPAGENIRLTVVSADVAHSWWIPRLGGKLDAIPGRTNHTWFRARRPGVYTGQCAEFCGIQHAAMLATVDALPKGEFASWLAGAATAQAAGASDLGQQTFTGVCAPCHGDRGQGFIGPKLAGNPLFNDRAGITALLRNGRFTSASRFMPAVGKTWDNRQLVAAIEYLRRRFAPKGVTSGG